MFLAPPLVLVRFLFELLLHCFRHKVLLITLQERDSLSYPLCPRLGTVLFSS
jgi:hypothetical protein